MRRTEYRRTSKVHGTKMKPILIATFGYPGSGKSHFSEKISKELHYAHLRSDEIRHQIFLNSKFNLEENIVIFRVMDFLAGKLLSTGVSVIYDANSHLYSQRQSLRDIAEKANARFALIHIETQLEIAVERARTREFHPVERSVVESVRNEAEDITNEFPIIIDGTKSYEEQKDFIMRELVKK